MGETNEEPLFFSTIQYFELISKVSRAAREVRASNISLEEEWFNEILRQPIVEEKKDFKEARDAVPCDLREYL